MINICSVIRKHVVYYMCQNHTKRMSSSSFSHYHNIEIKSEKPKSLEPFLIK